MPVSTAGSAPGSSSVGAVGAVTPPIVSGNGICEPLKYHTDFREWKRLLRHAGLREARLHDARHTAATVLLLLGVPARTVMSLMGWSSAEMAARYQHVTDTIRREVARQVDDLISQARGAADHGDSDRTVQFDREALAMILRLAELGLAHDEEVDRIESRTVIEQVRTALRRDA